MSFLVVCLRGLKVLIFYWDSVSCVSVEVGMEWRSVTF